MSCNTLFNSNTLNGSNFPHLRVLYRFLASGLCVWIPLSSELGTRLFTNTGLDLLIFYSSVIGEGGVSEYDPIPVGKEIYQRRDCDLFPGSARPCQSSVQRTEEPQIKVKRPIIAPTELITATFSLAAPVRCRS